MDEQGRYLGLGTVLDLLKAMSEQRVAQRNRVLHKTLQDLRESQAQLVQSEKHGILDCMVAGVAHELNTPLGYVKNKAAAARAADSAAEPGRDTGAAQRMGLDDPACDPDDSACTRAAFEQVHEHGTGATGGRPRPAVRRYRLRPRADRRAGRRPEGFRSAWTAPAARRSISTTVFAVRCWIARNSVKKVRGAWQPNWARCPRSPVHRARSTSPLNPFTNAAQAMRLARSR